MIFFSHQWTLKVSLWIWIEMKPHFILRYIQLIFCFSFIDWILFVIISKRERWNQVIKNQKFGITSKKQRMVTLLLVRFAKKISICGNTANLNLHLNWVYSLVINPWFKFYWLNFIFYHEKKIKPANKKMKSLKLLIGKKKKK